jgi:hypothetical protein
MLNISGKQKQYNINANQIARFIGYLNKFLKNYHRQYYIRQLNRVGMVPYPKAGRPTNEARLNRIITLENYQKITQSAIYIKQNNDNNNQISITDDNNNTLN